MSKLKKVSGLTAIVLSLSLVLSACGGSEKAVETSTADQTTIVSEQSTAVKSTEPVKKSKFKFYGKVNEFSSFDGMTQALQEKFKDKYDFEFIPVDWGNLEKVVRTGIASGDPCDIYEYWPQSLRPFIDSKMVLDLTPALEENGGEWKNTFTPAHLDMGKYDEKYYGLPYAANYSVFYINQDLFDKAGVAVPTKWNWDEFMAACKTIKEKTGVYPMSIPNADLGAWAIVNGIQSIMKSEGKLDDFAEGRIDYTTVAPQFKTVFKNLKAVFKDYAYPGKGAVTLKRDEAKAALMQGKVAMVGEVAVYASDWSKEATGFKLGIAPWPTMGTADVVLGGADGFMIPANAKDTEASLEVLKAFFSMDIMKMHADAGYPVSFQSIEITNPVVKQIVALSGNVYPKEFENIDPKLSEYLGKNMLAELILSNKDEDSIINKLESYRKTTLK